MSNPVAPGSFAPPPNAIGFLRVILATLVVYSHAHFLGGFPPEPVHIWTDGRLSLGTLAVQSFFVISGWLLTSSWLRQPMLLPYLRNRALRMLPAWWCCLAVTAFMFAPLVFFTAHPATGFWTQEPGPAAYIWRNLFFPRSQIAIGHTLSTNPWGSDWNGSLWTLFYEGASYLLLATAGLMGLLQRRAHWGFGAILLLLVFHALWQSTAHPSAIAWLFDTPGKNLCLLFAAGMAIVLAPGTWKSRLTCKTAGFTAAVLLALAWKLGAGPALSPLLLPPVVLSLSLHLPLSRWESLVGGDYSYGLYLYAYPVAQLLSFFEMQRWGYGPYFFFNLTLALLCALASWHWLERPVLTFKNSHGARHFLIASFICKLKEPGRYIRARNPAGERHQQS